MIYAEAEAKGILADLGIAIPEGVLLTEGALPELAGRETVYVKAQLGEGGRGKRGLVRRAASAAELSIATEAIRAAAPGAALLVEEAVPTVSERYIAIGLDSARRAVKLVIGSHGGVDVEETEPATLAEKRFRISRGARPHDGVVLARQLGLPSAEAASLGRVAVAMWRAFERHSAELLEINPLIWDGAAHVAADAKLVTYEREMTAGVVYYERPGSVALLSGGAGLGMALADMLTHLGTPPANFGDIVGGVKPERMSELARLVAARSRSPEVGSMLFLFTVSHTPLERVVDPVLDVLADDPVDVPIVAFLHGGIPDEGDARARERLAGFGIVNHDSLEPALTEVSRLAKEAA